MTATFGKLQGHTLELKGGLNIIHGDKANVLFADGHSGTLGKADAYNRGFAIYFENGEMGTSVK